ncbi:CHAT domain-containing protein [Winogradskyella tangerina]|uniref:CHAT domain-containing protein n=1 Tax=Winogradskyella tangerina TaxID=2023240 RepID=UPI000DBE63A7|nr:CHAT domain-containing protein [Winogradskyella tangerina]
MKFLASFIILITLQSFSQSKDQPQQYFDTKIEEINKLAKEGKVMQAIIEGEDLKAFAYENFKDSNHNLKTILFKLNFYYRYTKDTQNELKTNIELNKVRQDDLEFERKSFEESLVNLIAFYNDTDNPREIIQTFTKINQSLFAHAEEALSERYNDEKERFINENILPYFNLFHSFAYKYNYKYGVFNTLLVNNTLLTKGALLNTSKDILGKLRSINNANINQKINAYINEKEFIALQLSLPESQRVEDFELRRDRLGGLESELVTIYQFHFKDERKRPINWRRTALLEDEISIEFTHFRRYDGEWTDNTIYVAQLFKKNWRYPKIIPLFEEKEIKTILSQNSSANLYKARGSKGRLVNASSYAKEIYNLILSPLEEELKGVSKIYFSPDGILHQVAFAALTNEKNERLIELYDLEQVSNSKVITLKRNNPESEDALFVGGINYDFDVEGKTKLFSNQPSLSEVLMSQDNLNDQQLIKSWEYLEGSATEINNINDLFSSNFKTSDQLVGDDATETVFKSLNGKSPNVLHIATHGFFFDNNKDNGANTVEFKKAKNPLLRSGLLLAHANYAWQFGSNPYERNDGILTALEISNLDLSNTKLVVLSACETGLGDIKGNEGVYGLQRAFKMAGVQMIIMSLWEVPDIETAEFMTSFYELWLNNNTVREAFIETQRKMLKSYPNNPEKWAAFVLIE